MPTADSACSVWIPCEVQSPEILHVSELRGAVGHLSKQGNAFSGVQPDNAVAAAVLNRLPSP